MTFGSIGPILFLSLAVQYRRRSVCDSLVPDGLDDRHLPPPARSVPGYDCLCLARAIALCPHWCSVSSPSYTFSDQRRKQNSMKLFQALFVVGSAALPALLPAASTYDALYVHVPFEFVAAGQRFSPVPGVPGEATSPLLGLPPRLPPPAGSGMKFLLTWRPTPLNVRERV